MSNDEFTNDLELFYSDYIKKHRIDGLVEKEVNDVFALYIARYLEYSDKKFDIRLN